MSWFDSIRNAQQTAAPAVPSSMQPAAATPQWGGFTNDNVFQSWDLNPLSQQTGVSRDDLSAERDAYLQPIESSYRTARDRQSIKTDASGQSLWADPEFQSYARTGTLGTGGTIAGLGSASQQYGFGSSLAPWTQQFQAPSATDAINSPGLQYAMDRAKQAIERSAAAKGTLLTGGTLRDLSENQIGMALQGYGDVYGRARDQYMIGRDNFYANQDRPFDKLTSLADLGRPV